MLKKLLVAVATLFASIGFAFAQVDVNKADQAALDGIKGIGPATSKKILDERSKGGAFKDWPDLEKRVKGIGAKNAVKMSQAGLTVNNQPLAGAPAAAAPTTAKGKVKETVEAKPAKTAPATSAPAASTAAAAPAASAKPVSATAAKAKPGEKPMADAASAKK
ncbi:MAG: helix-hairpin-helix domain-containing protein [Herminiimonas sp.]|nr:helix-hairpin-helix domain-containing protein [Herminiimonas sp.]